MSSRTLILAIRALLQAGVSEERIIEIVEELVLVYETQKMYADTEPCPRMCADTESCKA